MTARVRSLADVLGVPLDERASRVARAVDAALVEVVGIVDGGAKEDVIRRRERVAALLWTAGLVAEPEPDREVLRRLRRERLDAGLGKHGERLEMPADPARPYRYVGEEVETPDEEPFRMPHRVSGLDR